MKALEAGRAPNRDELLARPPGLGADPPAFFAAESLVDRVAAPLRTPDSDETTGLTEPPSAGPGTWIAYFGDYRLLEELGRGGRALCTRHGRRHSPERSRSR